MPDPSPTLVRTPTETLMSALSECETADNCIIILRHKSDISWHETTTASSDVLGLLEFVLTCVKGRIMREEMMRDCGDCGGCDCGCHGDDDKEVR